MKIEQKTNEWNAYKSKWKAALEKGIKIDLVNQNILYLGASSGTTVGHISKLTKGIVFAVEKSNKMAVRLIKLAKERKNIAPIFGDAHDSRLIKKSIFGKEINIVFQDIPSLDQLEILEKVSKIVKKDCGFLFSLKAKSMSQKNSKEIVENVRRRLKEKFKIIEETSLEPFHKHHWFFVLEKK